MLAPTLIDLNPVELKCYLFMINLDKVYVVEVAMSYRQKYVFPKKTKYIKVKPFNMITKKNEAKIMAKHISCDRRCRFNNTTCNSNQKWSNETCEFKCKNYCTFKKDYSWNPIEIMEFYIKL